MMLDAAGKALAQSLSRPLLATLGKAVVVTIMLLGALSWLLVRLAELLPPMPWMWLNATLSVLVSLGIVVAVVLLLTPVAMIVIGLFLDEIAAKVESKHYPALPPPRRIGLGEALANVAGLAGLSLVLNVIALPAYIFLPGLNLVLYFAINGSLIGREYFLLVAARRLGPVEARVLRRRNALRLFLAGDLVAFLLLIPGVSFLAPLFGTALMVHLVETMRRGQEPAHTGDAVVPGYAERLCDDRRDTDRR